MAKVSKAAASYRDRSPKGDQQCAGCTMFQPPAACTAVEGQIARRGWCAFFKRQATQ